MNIRDPKKFLETLWDWTPFNRCFQGTSIRIADLDGIVERNGYFLVIETKLPNQEIPDGQRYLLDTLSQLPNFTVLIVWGKPNQPDHAAVWGSSPIKAKTMDDLIEYVTQWFHKHDKKPRYRLPSTAARPHKGGVFRGLFGR